MYVLRQLIWAGFECLKDLPLTILCNIQKRPAMKSAFNLNMLPFVLLVSLFCCCSGKKTIATSGDENNATSGAIAGSDVVNAWLTTPDAANLIKQQPNCSFASGTVTNPLTINIDERQT